MPTVTVVQQSLRRYRGAFYHHLRAQLAAAGVELRVVEARPPELPEHRGDHLELGWAEQADARLITVAGRELIWQDVRGATRDADLVIVEQGSRLLANYLLLADQWRGRSRLAYWGHGQDFHASASSLGERLKAFTSRRVHWWFAYNRLAVDVVRDLGFPAERITDVRNATDTTQLRELLAGVGPSERARVRNELGLGPGPVGLTVGTMSAAKRLDYLFAAADHVRAQVPTFQLVLAGGGERRDEVLDEASRRDWVTVVGPTFGRDLAGLLTVADVMLVPAGVGLVVVDAFAAGLPLVASASQHHRPEVDYLEDGVSGLLVDDAGDPATYGDAVVSLLADGPRRDALARGAAAAADDLTVERMAERFTSGILAALAT